MVKIVFYEKPGCANNSRQKAQLTAAGHDLQVRDLLSWPWTAETLAGFFGDRPVAEWFNRAAPRVKSGEIIPEAMDRDTALSAMLADPLLIRRPLMEAAGRRDVGFDPARLQGWIALPEDRPAAPETCNRGEENRCRQH